MSQAAGPEDEGDRPGAARRLTTGKLLRFGLSAALVGAIFFYVLPQIADFSEVWAAISNMTWPASSLWAARKMVQAVS